jgi:outer membrane protein
MAWLNLNTSVNHGQNQVQNVDPFTNTYQNQQLQFENYSLTNSSILWNGNATRNNKNSSSLKFDAAKLDGQQAKDNITINVNLAYLQVLNSKEQMTAAINRRELTQKQVLRRNILHANGTVQPSIYFDLIAHN